MNISLTKIKNSTAVKYIKAALLSKYFPFVTAAVVLACYYLSLDLVAILYIGVTGTLITLLSDDITPLITDLLFVRVTLSWKHSPDGSKGNSDYFSRPEILTPIIIITVIFLSALIYRLVIACIRKKFRFSPTFFTLCGLCAALLLNGAFSKYYNALSFMYGAVLTVLFLGLFAVFKDNITANKKTFEHIAYGFTAFSVLLLVELAVLYIAKDNLFIRIKDDRNLISFGWGPYTSYGVQLAMCIPAVFYLATKKKYGVVYTAYSVFLFLGVILCCSRQAMISAAIIYPVCALILIIKGGCKIANLCIIAAALIAGIVTVGILQDKIFDFFRTIFSNVFQNGELNGSGRMLLWRQAIDDFRQCPIFGVGFYKGKTGGLHLGSRLTPVMYHNTVLQMLGACGIAGLAAYTAHRVQTAVCYFKNVTVERTAVALIIAVLLINSLMDIHLFNIFPTAVYSLLLAVLDKSERKSAQ